MVRQWLFNNAADQRHPEWVFGMLHQLLRLRLKAGVPTTYVDATNLARRDRSHFFAMAREFGCDVDGLYFDVPLKLCLERNRRRARRVPEEAIRRMAARFDPPSLEEGFRRLRVVRPLGRGWSPPVPYQPPAAEEKARARKPADALS